MTLKSPDGLIRAFFLMCMGNLANLFKEFLIIGSTSFGGYMALIAMVRNRFVSKEKLVDDETITEGIAIASLLPGPVAVNVVAYVGYVLAGVKGAIVSVTAVLIPSLVLVTAFAALYFTYSELINATAILKGIMPAIVALLLSVAATMGLKSVEKFQDFIVLSFAAFIFVVIPHYGILVGLLVLSAVRGIIFKRPGGQHVQMKPSLSRLFYLVAVPLAFMLVYLSVTYFFPEQLTARLFTEFASISLTLFGGGYVMVPLLKSILVDQTGWFSLQEFMAGISVGQVTPGPILISAAFFGFKLKGITGAVIATVAIFLPSSMLMIMVSKFFFHFRSNPYIVAAMAGIKPAIVGLILAAAFSIFLDYWTGANHVITVITLVISFLLFFRFKINPAIVVLISGMVGYLVYSV
jgi:chromate transporter